MIDRPPAWSGPPPKARHLPISHLAADRHRGNEADQVERAVDHHPRHDAAHARPQPRERAAEERDLDEAADEAVREAEGDSRSGDRGPDPERGEEGEPDAPEEQLLHER